jgi:hypothetical protein
MEGIQVRKRAFRSTALREVSKRLGRSKYNDYMGGAMMPVGDLTEAEVLSIVFGGKSDDWQKELDFHSEREFKRLLSR